MSFGIYMVGYALFVTGLGYAAYLLLVPSHWIFAAVLVLVGIGILTGMTATEQEGRR